MSRVLIAGGGVGGATLAILLGRLGIEVELFERGAFPREKPCGEAIMPSGTATLERLGLTHAVGGAPFYSVRYDLRDFTLEGKFPNRNGIRIAGCGQRRILLDATLFAIAAATPGVSAQTGAIVEAPIIENGRVTGLIVDGKPQRGDVVVAADGLHSPIRKALGLDLSPRRRRFGMRMHFRVQPGCEQPPRIDIYPRNGYELYITPLPDGEILVAALVEAGRIEKSAEEEFAGWLAAEPELAEKLQGAEQLSSLAGCSPIESRARCGVFPGCVLLGDAAGFMDPITASGLGHALATAELLSKYVAKMRRSRTDWIWQFERERRALMRDNRILTGAALWLARHPRIARGAYQAIRPTPAVFSHFISVACGARRMWGTAAS